MKTYENLKKAYCNPTYRPFPNHENILGSFHDLNVLVDGKDKNIEDKELDELLSSFQKIAESSMNQVLIINNKKRGKTKSKNLVVGNDGVVSSVPLTIALPWGESGIPINCNGLGHLCKRNWLCEIAFSKVPSFIGDDVIVISSDKAEGSGDWNSPEYQDTAVSKGKEAFDGEINLAFDENLISNEFAVKLCLDYEVKKGKSHFGKIIPKTIYGIVDFGNGVITIYSELDPFEDDSEKTGKSSDDWDQLLYFNLDDVPKSGEELSLFICKMGKSNRNKKRAMENFNLFYQDVGPSASAGRHLTQEEAAKEELAIRISQRYALLEEERPVIETMAYNDKYKMILDEIWKDKVELDGKTVKEDEEAVKRIKGEALKEKEDPGAFIFPIRLEGRVTENALADTGSDINTMPYRIFEKIGREDTKKVDRRKIMIYHTQTKAMGKLSNILCQVGVTTIIAKFIILDIPIDGDVPIVVGRGFLLESDTDDEEEYVIKRNKFGAPIYGPRPALYLNCANPEDRSSARSEKLVFGRKQLTSLVHYPYHLSKSTGSLIIKAHIRKRKK
ncbi:agenet domain-containing protein [Tanacetum coccineum]